MGFISQWRDHHSFQWRSLKYNKRSLEAAAYPFAMQLYGVRIAAMIISAGVWVALTLFFGIFTVAVVIMVGLLVGNAHRLLPHMHRHHLANAISLTLLGGIFANVLAGLALFSADFGVSYWQVLAARQFPQDLILLGGLFVDAFRPQDLLYYLIAIAAAIRFAQRPVTSRR
jgi:hypothetical protein